MTFRKSLAWVTAQFLVVLSIELASLAVLARVLRPVEIGWFAAALAILEFARFLGAMELHTVVVRSDRTDAGFRSNVLAIALGASTVLALVLTGLLLVAPVDLIGEVPRQLLLVMLPTLLLNCFAMAGHALLLRECRFEVIFYLKLASTLAFVAIAISLALGGAGAFALAWGLIASTTVHAILATIATKGAFFVWPSLSGASATTRLAGTILTIAVSHHATLSAVPLLIGRMFGFATLGQFARAEDFIRQARRILEDTIMPALIPFVFDAARKDELRQEALRPQFSVALSNLTAVVWPGTVLVLLLSGPIVSVLLGPQWTEVPLVLQILAFGFLAYPLSSLSYIFSVALRREAALAQAAILSLLLSIVAVLALGSFGLAVVCFAVVAVQLLHAIVRLAITIGSLDLGVRAVLAALAHSFWLTLVVSGLFGLLTMALSVAGVPDIYVLICLGAVALPIWIGAVFALRHPVGAEIALILKARQAS